MRTTCRPTQATRVLTDRAAGAAGGQSRCGYGGRGSDLRVITPGRSRCALVPGRPLRQGRGREARQREVARPVAGSRTHCWLGTRPSCVADLGHAARPGLDLSPANTVSAR